MFFDDYVEPKTKEAKPKKRFEGTLRRLMYPPKFREYSTNPLTEFAGGDAVTMDTEVYRNYFLAAFKHVETGKYFYLEAWPGKPLDRDALAMCMFYFKIITFNGIRYDIPIIEHATKGADCDEIKELSDAIIKDKEYHTSKVNYNHIDLIEVAPLPDTSLKTYAGRLHTTRMQEIPIDEAQMLSNTDMDAVREYCFNDLDNTELLWHEVGEPMRLREAMSAEYKVDLRSKSDAQMAEAVIGEELKRLTGYYPKKPQFDHDFSFKYKAPSLVKFKTKQLQDALRTIENATFELDGGGSPMMPKEIAGLKIKLGRSTYKMGMGGLHSTEKTQKLSADAEYAVIDRDVASFYPFIILNNRFFPQGLGEGFLSVYRTIVERRLDAKAKAAAFKKAGDLVASKMWATISDGLKITINGTFGKLGSMWSIIYSPDLLLQVTITGQLYLLMMIEAIEEIGINVFSANTDGIVIKCPRHREDELNAVIKEWETVTSLETEETRYKALYSRDVNNYIAVKEDDNTCKPKGYYSERGSAQNSVLSKNPEHLICSDAMQALMSHGTPIEETIRNCKDVRRFVVMRNVRGGAHSDGMYLGKVCRWYFAEGNFDSMNYVMSGNKVPGTDGAKHLMELPTLVPDDINYRWYIEKTYRMLDKIGYYGSKPQQQMLI